MAYVIASRSTGKIHSRKRFDSRDLADTEIQKLPGGRRAFGSIGAPLTKADLEYNARAIRSMQCTPKQAKTLFDMQEAA